MKLNDLFQKFFPTRGIQIVAIVLAGCLCGLASYIFYASKAVSYLSDDPATCVNCHIMSPYYATWDHSSHARVATCNDCHVPHDNFFRKWYFKGKDGLRHASIFAIRQEPQVIQAIDESAEVIMENCIRCHTQLNQEFVKTGRIMYANVQEGEGKACWDCHRDVPHGGTNGLSSTPNAIVPYPQAVVPEWLRKKMKELKE